MTANAQNVKEQMALVPMEHELTVYNTMAQRAVASKMYRNIGDDAAVMTIMLSARELGISPMTAINGGLNIIQGRVEISARMMNALIRRAGHSIQCIESSDNVCRLKGKRRDTGDEEEASFSIEEAKRAGLIKPGGGWTKYPSDMLYARALSRLARRLFSDVIGCAYVEGEIIDAKVEVVQNVQPQQIEQEAEIIDQKDNDVFRNFVAHFDKDEGMFMAKYIQIVHEKLEMSYKDIIAKYHSDPNGFMEKFEKWKEQQSK